MKDKVLISVVCPVYNEQDSIPIFYKRLSDAISPLRNRYNFELIFLNNCSKDATLDVILSIIEIDPTVKVLTYSRNFGYQASLLTGITKAKGKAIIIIDVDCEDPPEMIPKFIQKWEEGNDIVYGIRKNRNEWFGLVLIRKMFYRILKMMADTEIILDMAEFSLFSSTIRDYIISNKNTFPFIRAEIGYVGFSRYGIEYKRQTRVSGKTKYNIWGMILFGAGGILSISTAPMRLAIYVYPLIVLFNVTLLILDLLYSHITILFKMLVALDILYVIFLLSVFGLYIARIYKNSLGRPVTIIDWRRSYFDLEDKEK